MIRRIGAPPRKNQRHIARPGAYAILPLQRRVLLTGQMEETLDIQLPGGGIDPGESPIQALHREVLEEIGWKIATPRRLGAFRQYVFMPEYDLWAEKICHVYTAHPVRKIMEPSEDNHLTMVLSPQDAVQAIGSPGSQLFIKKYFGLS